MSGEGMLRLRVGRDGSGRYHRIGIEDSGKGVPEEHRPHIFEPFFTSGKTQGVGLGLFVAARILKKHDGNVAVEESDLGGTAMVVDLPALPEKSNGNAPADR
jgi:signal transduction histidine kinase